MYIQHYFSSYTNLFVAIVSILSIYPFNHLSIYQSIHLFIFLSIRNTGFIFTEATIYWKELEHTKGMDVNQKCMNMKQERIFAQLVEQLTLKLRIISSNSAAALKRFLSHLAFIFMVLWFRTALPSIFQALPSMA